MGFLAWMMVMFPHSPLANHIRDKYFETTLAYCNHNAHTLQYEVISTHKCT